MGHDAGGHDRIEEGVLIIAVVEGDRRDPHGRADARCLLTAPAGRHPAFQLGQDLAEAPADTPMGADERPLRVRQRKVNLGQAIGIEPVARSSRTSQIASACCVSSE